MNKPSKMVAVALTLGALHGIGGALWAQNASAAAEKTAAGREQPSAGSPVLDPKNPTPPSGAAGEAGKETATRSYDFNSLLSKRDPFKSLIKKSVIDVDASPNNAKRPSGLRGMLISELKLVGLARDLTGDRIAIVTGPDQKAHFIKVGDRVWDGTVKTVDDTTVLFVKETKRAAGASRFEDVKMYLYPPIQQ